MHTHTQLSKHHLFFTAREILERGEDYYRKALCVRPQWKEILHRLGDVHCEQAKYTRVPAVAQRLRVRGGTRYLQVRSEMCIHALRANEKDCVIFASFGGHSWPADEACARLYQHTVRQMHFAVWKKMMKKRV